MKKYNEEVLVKMTVKELSELAKAENITRYEGKKAKAKKTLIENLLEVEEEVKEVAKEVTEVEEKQEVKTKSDYLQGIKPGVLIAFDDNDRCNSAKVLNVSFKREELKIETAQRDVIIIPFSSVLWVKTRDRFPMYILKLLKDRSSVKETVYRKE